MRYVTTSVAQLRLFLSNFESDSQVEVEIDGESAYIAEMWRDKETPRISIRLSPVHPKSFNGDILEEMTCSEEEI